MGSTFITREEEGGGGLYCMRQVPVFVFLFAPTCSAAAADMGHGTMRFSCVVDCRCTYVCHKYIGHMSKT
jgi:hypothetical protein